MKAGAKTKGQIPQPKPYTRSHEGEERKAAVPGRDDKPIYGLKTSKNYVTANAVENILQAPKRVPQTEERYTAKEDFGKVPDYLVRIKQERQEEDEFIKHIQQMRAEQTGVKILPEEERLKILARLKERQIGILITDHNYRETLDITDRSYVIFEGQVLCEGDAATLLADPAVQRVYLGDRSEVGDPTP